MITQSQCALLFIGLGVISLVAIRVSLWNDRAIEASANPVGATKHLIIGILFLVAVYAVAVWWNNQFQPGGYFLP